MESDHSTQLSPGIELIYTKDLAQRLCSAPMVVVRVINAAFSFHANMSWIAASVVAPLPRANVVSIFAWEKTSCMSANLSDVCSPDRTVHRTRSATSETAAASTARQATLHPAQYLRSSACGQCAGLRPLRRLLRSISGAIPTPRALAHGRRRMEDLPGLLSSSGAGKANA